MALADLVVTGANVLHDGTLDRLELGITDGEITHISKPGMGPDGRASLELDGELVIPGAVEEHIHLREPGYVEKEGIVTGSAAAAAGGVTTIVEMPNTTPPVSTRARWEEKAALFDRKSHVDFALYGAITEDNVGTGDIQELAAAGATGFKTFMATSFGPLLISDKALLLSAFEEVNETGRPIYIHAEDEEYLDGFRERVERDGTSGMDAFFDSRPPIAETTAIADVLDIVRETGTETVVVHVTTSEGVDRIDRARQAGLPVDTEVTPYHLAFDEERLRAVGTEGIGTPPVRDEENRQALWSRLMDGRVQLLGSDHAPHTVAEKDGEPLEVPPGMPQVETALSFLLDAVNRGHVTIQQVVDCYSTRPAKKHGLYPRKGTISVGSDADFVVVDLDESWTVDPADFESSGKYSPFDGWTFSASILSTYQRGELIAEDRHTTNSPGDGQLYQRAD
jgi:dihydroorotase